MCLFVIYGYVCCTTNEEQHQKVDLGTEGRWGEKSDFFEYEYGDAKVKQNLT